MWLPRASCPSGAKNARIPGADGRRVDSQEELREKLHNPPEPLLSKLSAFLCEGIVRQLTSMPMDLRVEREVAEMLSDHHEAQQPTN